MVSAELVGGARSQGNTPGLYVDAQSKGLFSVDGVPAGENSLVVRVMDRKYYVKSITWSDRDLLRQPLNVVEGSEVRGVRIVLSGEVATLTGISCQGKARKRCRAR
jgi:hypothetical protein